MFTEATAAISQPVHQCPVALDIQAITAANNAISQAVRQPNRSNRNARKTQLREEKAFLEQPLSVRSESELASFLQTKTGRRLYGITPPAQANQLASNCVRFLKLVAPQLQSKIRARLFENVNVHEFSICPIEPVDDECILEPKPTAQRKSIPA